MHFLKLIKFVEDNKDKIDWTCLSENPNAIHLLEQTMEQNPQSVASIDWRWLSSNPNAIHLLEQNLDKIDWYTLSGNPNIFKYNYQAMKDHLWKSGIVEELMTNRFHPDNIRNGKVGNWGFEDMVPPDIVHD